MPSSMLMRYRPPLTGLESHLSGLDVLRKKDFDHKTELHKSRLKNMKPMIDNKPPATTNMKHLQFNRKKREMDFQRYSAIEKENFRLLDKMSRIMVRNAADSVFGEHTNLNCPALDGERARKKKMDKLVEQNQLIGRRLREAKPYYSLAEWDKHTHKTHSLMSHICKYPNQVFQLRDSSHSLTVKDSLDELDIGKESIRSRASEASSGGGHTKVLRRRPLPALNTQKGSRSRSGAESAPPILEGEGDQPSDPNGSAKLKADEVEEADETETVKTKSAADGDGELSALNESRESASYSFEFEGDSKNED
mmetsp:Transcript_32392/g.72759  ORF Transcript_32392/g.72759 Transcript_32392/m.72759 type:complete len:308 (-) Transcript_32392:446-1369(-)